MLEIRKNYFAGGFGHEEMDRPNGNSDSGGADLL